MKEKTISITTGLGCFTAILFSWWTDRTLDFWCSYFTGREIDIPFIISFLVNLFFGIIAMMANIISEIAKICIS